MSEKYGEIIPGNFTTDVKVDCNFFNRDGYRVEIISLRMERDDTITFSDVPWPYTLIFIFGYSITLYLCKDLKREIHDRGSHLFHTREKSFRIRFRGQRDYIIYCIHYSPEFVQKSLEEAAQYIRISWEMLSPVFYNNRSKIVRREAMDLLSMLLLPVTTELTTDFVKDELARAVIMDFLREYAYSFQPSQVSAAQFETFYHERDTLIRKSLGNKQLSELLRISGIRQVPLFRKRLRQLYDLNIREFVTEIRMSMAMSLLNDPTLSIKEIAGKTGFSNAFYFSRVFTNYFGQPPTYFHKKDK